MDPNDQLKREQNAQFRLGNLLLKERSPYKAGLVDKLVTSSLSTEEKILRILDVDAGADEAPQVPEKPKPRNRESELSNPEGQGLDQPAPKKETTRGGEDRVAARNRQRYLSQPARGGLFSFLFKDLWLMRNFGTATGTMASPLLPFFLHLDPDAIAGFRRTILGTLVPSIKKVLDAVLEKSWRYLPKFEYNELSALRELCVHLLDLGDKLQIKAKKTPHPFPLGPAHSLFFLFHNNRDKLSNLRVLVEQAGKRTALHLEVVKQATAAMDVLFDPREERNTPANFLRADAMLVASKFLHISDMGPIIKDWSPFIAQEQFDCSEAVLKDINRFIHEARIRIEELAKRTRILERMHFYLPGIDKPDMGLLEATYTSNGAQDTDNPTLWALRFLDLYLRMAGPLLETPIYGKSGKPEILAPKSAIKTILARIREDAETLGTALTAKPDFRYHRWQQVRKDPSQGSPPEQAMVSGLADLASQFGALAKTLVDIIRTRSGTAPFPVRDEANISDTSPLPHETHIQNLPGTLNGLTTLEALVMTTRLAWLMGIKLGDDGIIIEWHERKKVLGEIKKLLIQIGHIGSKDDLDDALALYTFVSGCEINLVLPSEEEMAVYDGWSDALSQSY